MTEFAGQGNLAVWYSHANMDDILTQIGSQLVGVRPSGTSSAGYS